MDSSCWAEGAPFGQGTFFPLTHARPLPDAAAGTSGARCHCGKCCSLSLTPAAFSRFRCPAAPADPAPRAPCSARLRTAPGQHQCTDGFGLGVKMTGSPGTSAVLRGTPSSVSLVLWGWPWRGRWGKGMPPRRVVPAPPLGVVPAGSVARTRGGQA